MNAKGCVAVLCVGCLLGTAVPSRGDSPLATGIQQAQEGEYAAAVTTLRGVVERLAANPQAKADLKTAYVYLGVAHLGLDQESEARRAFVAGLKLDPALDLKTTDFPPRVVRFFERIHQEAIASGEVRRPPKVATKKKSGGGGKWLLVGGAVAAAGAGAVVLLGKGKNNPPTAGNISVAPASKGISSATKFTFTDNGATDPDGDQLTYIWTFGDGGSDQGQTLTHVFGAPSDYAVSVIVSDGKGGQASTGPVSVPVRSLNGIWIGHQDSIERRWNIVQNGAQLGGTYSHTGCPNATGSLSGSVADPRNVHIEAAISCFAAIVFDGVADDEVNTLTGSVGGVQLTFTRQ